MNLGQFEIRFQQACNCDPLFDLAQDLFRQGYREKHVNEFFSLMYRDMVLDANRIRLLNLVRDMEKGIIKVTNDKSCIELRQEDQDGKSKNRR